MRKLIVGLVVVALLALVADRVSKSIVENVLSEHIADAQGIDTSGDVDVDIGGFPFLTQVISHDFDEINVSMPAASTQTAVGAIRVEHLDITLHNFKTSDNFREGTADSVTGSGLISYESLSDLSDVDVSYGGKTSDGLGYVNLSVQGTALSFQIVPQLAKGSHLSLQTLDDLTAGLPSRVRSFLTVAYAISGLPRSIEVKAIDATPDGLALTLAGTQVRLSR